MTALIWAARNGKKDMIELLLEHGADLEAHSSSGETALLAGSGAGHEGIVRFLIDRGANLSAKDSSGQNALHKAAAYGHVHVMRLLLSHEDFHNTHNWHDPHVIRCIDMEKMIVNGGFSSVWSDYDEEDVFWRLYPKHSIQCLVMNEGFLYVCPKQEYSRVHIERIQINGGICYFNMMKIYALRIQELEINGGSLHLGEYGSTGVLRDIKTLELNNGCLSIFAADIEFQEVFLSGGSFNCNSSTNLRVHQLTLGSALSGSTGRQNLTNPSSTSCLAEIYVKHSDGQIEQHGTTQPGDQNLQMSTVLSPLYLAARNGHLEAVQLLLQSGAKFDKASHTMNPVDVAQRHGHHKIVRFLQEMGQVEEKKGEQEQKRMRRGQKQKRRRDEI